LAVEGKEEKKEEKEKEKEEEEPERRKRRSCIYISDFFGEDTFSPNLKKKFFPVRRE